MEELISMIVPAYNAERFLGECIESVFKQDYTNWELILVDDGSRDRTYEICVDYAKKDSRLRVFHNENHGVSYTRNFGMGVAKGEYLCFIDADDKILPDYITQLINQIKENEADVAFCGFQLLFGNKYVKKASRIKAGVYGFSDLSACAIDDGTLTGILFGSACASMYSRKMIKDSGVLFDSEVRRNEDGLFNLELLPHVNKIVVVDYTGYIYRQWKPVNRTQYTPVATDELNAVSDLIAQRCYFYDELDKQLKCRKFVILFWHAQRIANGECSAFKSVKLMKEYLDGVEIDDLYQNLNFSSLNRYKKFLIHLICKKRYFSFVILIRYIKPILEKCLQH